MHVTLYAHFCVRVRVMERCALLLRCVSSRTSGIEACEIGLRVVA